ncbi:MAG: diacylglycerol kinase family lipid kinase [Proteobacteria bacterium]|nr:diacylglycerol kinase family lipid kinase [Pseudomonadota bacterium]
MVIVFNPIAGRRRAHLMWRVLDVMAASGIRIEVAETQHAGHAEELAREAARRGETMVVAAGGDGTIAEVANGLMGSPTRLGVIPLGTANVLAHELALPFAPRAVAAALAFGRTRPLWPGMVSGPAGARLFVQMLGVGFDAHVVHRMSPPLKRLFGRGAYVLQTLREMARYRFAPIRLRVDGREMQAASAIVSKGRLYAGRYLLAPDAEPAQAGFSVVLFDGAGPGAALLYAAALPIDMLGRAPGVRHLRASRVEVIGNDAIPAQADGDAFGFAPLAISDAPGPIEVVAA